MDYFTGSEDNDGRFGWELDDTDTVIQTQPILPIGIQMVVDCSLLTLRLILLDGLTGHFLRNR